METVWNILIGLLTGIVSGVLVTEYYNWKSDIDRTYFFWLHYLSSAFAKSGMPMPIDEVRQLKAVGGQDSKFGKTYAKINARLQPLDMHKSLPHKETTIADLSVQAWKELNEWYDNVNSHRYRYFASHIFSRK